MTLSLITSKIAEIEAQFNGQKAYLGKIAESMRQLKAEEEKTLDAIKELKGSYQSLSDIKDLLEKNEVKQVPGLKEKPEKKSQ